MARRMAVAALAAGGLLAGAGVLSGVPVAPALFAGLGFASPAEAAQAAETVRIGVVDMQAVITQSARGQKARAKLQTETEAKQKDMNAREEEVRKLQAEMERQRAVLSPAALREKEETIQRKIRDVRRLAEDGQRDLNKREAELVGDIQREVVQVVTEYGKEKGYSVVLERSAGVWYVGERADLTKDIIDRFNAKAK